MYASMIVLFVAGVLVELGGVALIASGTDTRHYGAVAVFLGCVVAMTAAMVMDGLR